MRAGPSLGHHLWSLHTLLADTGLSTQALAPLGMRGSAFSCCKAPLPCTRACGLLGRPSACHGFSTHWQHGGQAQCAHLMPGRQRAGMHLHRQHERKLTVPISAQVVVWRKVRLALAECGRQQELPRARLSYTLLTRTHTRTYRCADMHMPWRVQHGVPMLHSTTAVRSQTCGMLGMPGGFHDFSTHQRHEARA